MEEKKLAKAQIENRKFLFITMGTVFALSLFLISLEWSQKMPKKSFNVVSNQPIEEVTIAPTQHFQNTPPPPPVYISQFIPVTNEKPVDNPLVGDPEIGPNDPVVKVAERIEEGIDSTDEIVDYTDEMPQFPGNIMSWIAQNIKYPVVAVENNIQGRVSIQFVVDKKGFVTNARVSRGVDASIDNEALRVVNSMPAWIPGKRKGQPVRVNYTVPINFVLH